MTTDRPRAALSRQALKVGDRARVIDREIVGEIVAIFDGSSVDQRPVAIVRRRHADRWGDHVVFLAEIEAAP